MVQQKETNEKESAEAWRTYLKSLENYLDQEEKAIDRAFQLNSTCTDELCETTEEVIDELTKAIFSVSEPRWITPEDAKRIKTLKRRAQDLYAKYKNAANR
ncbi:hypothetical protein [Desulfosarcina sp.]|uniref:hypothetical protein n=1 Tax=Desulfosarcina sp. TaxID=2027861 RepID=UPI0035656F0D